MQPAKTCARRGCHNPVEPGRRLYCGDACADTEARNRMKIRKAMLASMPKARKLYRYYPAS